MKKFLFIITAFFLFSCKCKTIEKEPVHTVIYDTIQIDKGFEKKYDSLLLVFQELPKQNDSLTAINKKLSQELLHKKLIIENAKYYLDICNRNPSQDKFLKGWMNRALNQ